MQIESVYNEIDNNAILNEWNLLSHSTSSSNPPTGQVIYIPGNYESGFSETTNDWCYGMGSSYYRTSDFWGSDDCAPTAGVNMMKYWTLRDSATFSGLKFVNSWTAVYNILYDLMNTNDYGTGTVNSYVTPAYMTYIDDKVGGTPVAYYKTYLNTVSEFNTYIKAQINNGRPVHLYLHEDDTYAPTGGHSVIGFGYIRYKYSGLWTSHYIMIADGWSSTPDRYIHYQTGRDRMHSTRLYPY